MSISHLFLSDQDPAEGQNPNLPKWSMQRVPVATMLRPFNYQYLVQSNEAEYLLSQQNLWAPDIMIQ